MELLYFLQNVRFCCPEWINNVMVIISESILISVPLIICCTYWCIDKKKGTYLICALALAFLGNEVLKLTFCVYRPWILDTRLIPAQEVIGTATNYSFPSSHSCATAVAVTGLSCAYPGSKKRTILSVLILVLVMFARMFLGCHSLIDVCCGAAWGVLVSLLLRPMLSDSFDDGNFTRRVLAVSVCLSVLCIIYVSVKNYPLDYKADGTLMVDPADMVPGAVGVSGGVLGLGIGLFMERKKINFAMPSGPKAGVLRILIGIAVLGIIYAVVLKLLFGWLPQSALKFLRYFVSIIAVSAAYPAIFSKLRILN